jgi:hypothetical protein
MDSDKIKWTVIVLVISASVFYWAIQQWGKSGNKAGEKARRQIKRVLVGEPAELKFV